MKNSSIRIISFMAIAIAINYIGANIALFLRLPIYLDMIWSLLSLDHGLVLVLLLSAH